MSLFFFLFVSLQIRVDIANKKLRQISPVIRKHGIEYEKSCFRKKLQSGQTSLIITKVKKQLSIQSIYF